MRKNRALSALDREMNKALKAVTSPAEAMSVRREFGVRRRQLLSGVRVESPIIGSPFEFTTNAPRVTWPAVSFEEIANDLLRLGQAMGERLNSRTWTFTAGETEQQKAAKERARAYLLAHLNDDQKCTFESKNYFIVQNRVSGRRWKIRTNTTAFNVDALDRDGGVINTFCGVPSGSPLPDADIWLAQKMLLETDEVEFLLRANRRERPYRDNEGSYRGALGDYEIRIVNNLSLL